MLEERGIHTAHEFANAPDGWVRQRMGVVGLRTVHELRGFVCHALEDQPSPKQTTCCSRTFGAAIREKSQVHDAVMSFSKGRQKVRHAGQVAGAVQLFIRTDPFPKAHRKSRCRARQPSSANVGYPRDLAAVLRIFDRIWRAGYDWRKAGVLLLDLGMPGDTPASLFDRIEAPDDGLMSAINQINARYGRGTASTWHRRTGNGACGAKTCRRALPRAGRTSPRPGSPSARQSGQACPAIPEMITSARSRGAEHARLVGDNLGEAALRLEFGNARSFGIDDLYPAGAVHPRRADCEIEGVRRLPCSAPHDCGSDLVGIGRNRAVDPRLSRVAST